jgi:hypothetical protein
MSVNAGKTQLPCFMPDCVFLSCYGEALQRSGYQGFAKKAMRFVFFVLLPETLRRPAAVKSRLTLSLHTGHIFAHRPGKQVIQTSGLQQ